MLTFIDTLLAHTDCLSNFGFAMVIAVHLHNGAVDFFQFVQCLMKLVNQHCPGKLQAPVSADACPHAKEDAYIRNTAPRLQES